VCTRFILILVGLNWGSQDPPLGYAPV